MSGLGNAVQTLAAAASGHVGQSNQFSLTLAEVKAINDDKKWNRVKCLPIGADDNQITDWCYVMSPMGGEDRGLFMFPQVGDLVVLGYLRNDVNSPIVLGSYWNTEKKAPLTVENDKAEDYCFKTPNNVHVAIHDESNKQKITVTMPSGSSTTVDDENQKVVTKDKDGKTSLTLDLKGGEIELKGDNKITLVSGNASITLEKNGNITIKGSGDVSIEGKSIALKAQGQMNVQGMDVTVKANKDLNMSASANASVKGMLLKLN